MTVERKKCGAEKKNQKYFYLHRRAWQESRAWKSLPKHQFYKSSLSLNVTSASLNGPISGFPCCYPLTSNPVHLNISAEHFPMHAIKSFLIPHQSLLLKNYSFITLIFIKQILWHFWEHTTLLYLAFIQSHLQQEDTSNNHSVD